MAVFMLNTCKFDDCGMTFPSLTDLIFHIEDTHIDYDPAVIKQKEQQQPQCLPLSYVLKFYSNSSHRESQLVDIKKRLIQHASKSSLKKCPINSRQDEEPVTESENSNDSWATSKSFSSEYILNFKKFTSTSIADSDKPFVCPVPGCKKRYKNLNGIKYHSKNGHKNDEKINKRYKCHCNKSYKTSQGLKNHCNVHHVSDSGSVSLNNLQNVDPGVSNLSTKNIINLVRSTKQTDPRTLEALRLKAILENTKKLQKAKLFHNSKIKDIIVETDLGVLTPATSPDSTFNNLSPQHGSVFVSSQCDINN